MFGFVNPWPRYLTALRRLTAHRRKNERRRTVRLDVERLEQRWLPSSGITEYATPTTSAGPMGIAAGSDGSLWFTETNVGKVGKITTGGTSTDYSLGTGHQPQFIAGGPDANLWFTDKVVMATSNDVGKCTTGGAITEYVVDGPGLSFFQIVGVTPGPDGSLWFTEVVASNGSFKGKVGKISTGGTVTLYTVATHTSPFSLGGIVTGPDGNLWFDELTDNKIGVLSTAGTLLHEYSVPTANSQPYWITLGPDNDLWFTEAGGNNIGRITPGGSITEFGIPTAASTPHGITAGPDGLLWFTESAGNNIGSLNPGNGAFTEFAVPTASSNPEGIAAAPNGSLWFTELSASKIGTFDWVLQAGAVQSDPAQGLRLSIDGQAGSWYSAHTGNLHVTVPLDFNLHAPT